jgi:hypothetical protein
MKKIISTRYYYSSLHDVHTAVIHLDEGPMVITEEGEQVSRPVLVVRISQETLGQFRCKSERDAGILLVSGSKLSDKASFHESLYKVQGAIEFILNDHTVEEGGVTKNESLLLKHVHSNLLEKLREEALSGENYQLAVYVRDEIDRRVESGYMERLPDGTARSIDIKAEDNENCEGSVVKLPTHQFDKS